MECKARTSYSVVHEAFGPHARRALQHFSTPRCGRLVSISACKLSQALADWLRRRRSCRADQRGFWKGRPFQNPLFGPSFCAGRGEDRPTPTPVRGHRAIAAEDLGLVEGLVGPLDERLASIPGLELRVPEARRYGGCRAGAVVGDLHPEAFCQPARFLEVGLGRKDDELFPTPAAQTVGSAEHALSGPYNLTQDAVPAVVSVGDVHALEVVQIEENDGERSLIALRFVRLLL